MTNGTKGDVALYLVPGIMGSTLVDTGLSPSGVRRDEVVWSDDLRQNKRTLGSNPGALSRDTLRPESVILELRGPFRSYDVYKSVVGYCTGQLGLSEGLDFFLFAYDWRQSCSTNAETLATFIKTNESDHDRQIVILAHSMGGLISRLMLMHTPDILRRTKKLLQVASPIEGAAKAYYTLKVRPTLHPVFDMIWTKAHKKRPELRAELQAAVSTFDAVYELLPPQHKQILVHDDGATFAATDRRAWQKHLHTRLDAAEELHAELAQSDAVMGHVLAVVYSDAFATVNGYLIDDNYLYRRAREQVNGDETVSTASALAQSSGCTPVKVKKRQNHSGIVDCAEVRAILREVVEA